jgi:hypothetical protein
VAGPALLSPSSTLPFTFVELACLACLPVRRPVNTLIFIFCPSLRLHIYSTHIHRIYHIQVCVIGLIVGGLFYDMPKDLVGSRSFFGALFLSVVRVAHCWPLKH